jgi:RNA-binding protein YlmH
VTGRKLNINNISIWIENGTPRVSGLALEQAQAQVRAYIAEAEEWLTAVEEQQKAVKAERLTPREELIVKRELQKNRKKFKAKGVSPEKARPSE